MPDELIIKSCGVLPCTLPYIGLKVLEKTLETTLESGNGRRF